MNAGGVGVPGKGVQDEDRVGLLGVEAPVGFIGQRHRPQRFAAFEQQLVGGFGEGEILRLDDLPPGRAFSVFTIFDAMLTFPVTPSQHLN